MKILAISNIFPPDFIGGYELGALDFVQGLQKKNHEVRVITSNLLHDDKKILSHLNVHRTLTIKTDYNYETLSTQEKLLDGLFYIPENIRTLSHHIIDQQPDCIICFNLHGLGTFSILSFLQSLNITTYIYFMDNPFAAIKLIYDAYNKYFEIFPSILQNTIYPIYLSQNIESEIKNHIGFNINNGVYIPNHHKLTTETYLNKKNNRLNMIYSSRITSHKGIFILLEAIYQLKEYIHDMKLDIYGDGEIESVIKFIEEKNLHDTVNIKGTINKEDLQLLYKNYSILPLPTWHREPGPYVVAEAAACGCIPVMSGGIGAAEYFIHEYDCIKCNRDTKSFRNALFRLYHMPENEFEKMRHNTQKTAFKFFTFEHCLDKMEEIILQHTKSNTSQDHIRGVEASLTTLFELWKEKINYERI